MSYISIGLLVLDILVVISLFIALLFGLIRGFGRTINRIIIFLIPVCLLFILLKPISAKVVKKEIMVPNQVTESLSDYLQVDLTEDLAQPISIQELIVKVVSYRVYPDDESLQTSSELATTATAISEMVVMIGVYLVGLILIVFAKILLTIIFAIVRKILKIKIPRKAHLLGMAAGVVNFVITFVLIFLPIYGLTSLASYVINDLDYCQNELGFVNDEIELVADEESELVALGKTLNHSFIKNYVISPISKVVCDDDDATFDAIYIGNALTFETEDGKVKFYDEYKLIKNTLPTVIKIYKMATDIGEGETIIKLNNLTEADLNSLMDMLKNCNLLRVVLPAVVEVSLYEFNQEQEISDLLFKLKDVNWNQELNALANVIGTLKQHLDVEIDTTSFETIISSPGVLDLIQDLVDRTLEISSITNIVLPLSINILEQTLEDEEMFNQYHLDLSGLKQIDFNNDAKGLVDCIFEVYKIYLDLDINFTDIKVALNNEKLPTAIDNALNEVQKSKILTDIIIPIAVEYAVVKLKEEQGLDLDYEFLKTVSWYDNLPQIASALKEIVDAYQTLDVDVDNFKSILNQKDLPNTLDNVIDKVLKVEVFKNYVLPIIMNKVCDYLKTMDGLKDFEIDFDVIKQASWQTEIIFFKDTFNAFVKMYQELAIDPEQWTLVLDEPSLNTYMKDIMDNALKSSIITEEILPNFASKIIALINENDTIDLSFMEEIITTENMINLLTSDLDYLIQIMQNLNQLNVLKTTDQTLDFSDADTQNALTNIIKIIFKLDIVNGKEQTIVEGLLNTFNLQNQFEQIGVTANYQNVTNWQTEINTLCDVFIKMMNMTGDLASFDFSTLLSLDKTYDEQVQIADVISSLAESKLFGASVYTVIEHMISEYAAEYAITFTEIDKATIKNETGWTQEITSIFNILDSAKSLVDSTNYKELDADNVKVIMQNASNSVIAAKIIGKELNKLFDGVIDEDFTDRQVLKDNVDVVYNAIKLSTMISGESFSLGNKEDTDELLTTINNLADCDNPTLVSEVLNKIVDFDEPMEITSTDIKNTANTLDKVIEAYQSADNQESFDFDDLSTELLEEVNNDKLAKTLLEYFF